jgi:tetratricopeptide (TPR) repeat protein
MTSKAEEMYLEAEADIRNSNYHDAFQKHESIIYEEPDFAPAHNSIGWLYKTQFDSYDKAEMHFKAAMKSDPLYPHPYFHLATLYIDLERLDDLKKHLERCLKIVTVEKAWIYYRYGMIEERRVNMIRLSSNTRKPFCIASAMTRSGITMRILTVVKPSRK